MDDMKTCSKCKTISLKCNLNKDVSTKDGLNSICKVCSIGYYSNKREQRNEYIEFYAKQKRERINLYYKKGENKFIFQISL